MKFQVHNNQTTVPRFLWVGEWCLLKCVWGLEPGRQLCRMCFHAEVAVGLITGPLKCPYTRYLCRFWSPTSFPNVLLLLCHFQTITLKCFSLFTVIPASPVWACEKAMLCFLFIFTLKVVATFLFGKAIGSTSFVLLCWADGIIARWCDAAMTFDLLQL